MLSALSTVKGKLFGLCVIAGLAFLVISAIALWSRAAVHAAIDQSQQMSQASSTLADMRLARAELVLAAMDSIVDRKSGAIGSERLGIIADSVDKLTAGLDAAKIIGVEVGMDDVAEEIRAEIAVLDKAAREDLKQLVESHAADADFDKIDDAIDGAGTQLALTLNRLALGAKASMSVRLDAANAAASTGLLTQALLSIGTGLLVLPLIAWIAATIAGRLSRLMQAMRRLADDDFEVEVPATQSHDEIGAMARAVEHFKSRGIEARALSAQQAHDREAGERRQAAIEALIAAFRKDVVVMSDGVESDVESMKETAAVLEAASHEMTDRSGDASVSSSTASTNVQQVAAAAEELAGSIGEITRQVAMANTMVGRASDRAKTANKEIAALAEGADRIGQVVTLIQTIAEQTNLLALNATIEAARAGEAGKGFAVVASEVKQLASQTAKATGEISAQISSIQAATKATVQAIGEIAETMSDADIYTSAIAAAVEEQGAATGEISRNAQEAAAGTSKVVGVLETVAGSIRSAVESAKDVGRVSHGLDDRSKKLSETIDAFLDRVAAA